MLQRVARAVVATGLVSALEGWQLLAQTKRGLLGGQVEQAQAAAFHARALPDSPGVARPSVMRHALLQKQKHIPLFKFNP